MAKFEQLEMLSGPESVLSKKELEENAQRLITGNRGLDFGYGIGFLVQRQAGHVFIGHSGAVAGYLALAMYQPAAETGIIILHNEIAPGMQKLMEVFTKTLPVKEPEGGGR
jgi:CubicO group peptidase (beta-lactamase class C family)